MNLPGPIAALGWGLFAGSALLPGAWIGFRFPLRQRAIAAIMAFGSGVLVSALTFELFEEAYERAGLAPAASGFLAGAGGFTAVNFVLARYGAKHRKRSGHRQPSEGEKSGSGLALAVGALFDGVPESIAIGVSLLEGGGVGLVTVIAVFLSNLPEGLASAAGMRASGRSAGYTYCVWAAIALASGAAAFAGNVLFRDVSPGLIGSTQAFAAGAILAMLADTMVPEAFEGTHDFTGLIVVAGFLASFALSKALG